MGFKYLPLLLIIISLVFAAFYWFEYRPSEIKKQCSWIKQTAEAKPGRAAMTELELKHKGLLRNCEPSTSPVPDWAARINQNANKVCEEENKQTIEEYRFEKPAVAAKEWWRKSTQHEYQFCLRDKGL